MVHAPLRFASLLGDIVDGEFFNSLDSGEYDDSDEDVSILVNGSWAPITISYIEDTRDSGIPASSRPDGVDRIVLDEVVGGDVSLDMLLDEMFSDVAATTVINVGDSDDEPAPKRARGSQCDHEHHDHDHIEEI